MHIRSGISKIVVAFMVCMVAAWLPASVFAAAYGQIKGKVVDKESGEPIFGASVVVVGKALGAKTDDKGEFVIPRVDPGIYSLKVTYIGYGSVEVTEVEVKTDLTTEINQKDLRLSKSVTDIGKTITVKGTKDIIDKFVTSNETSISKETIKQQPVTTVDQLLTQVAGVVQNSKGQVFIRGGRAGEVAYILDGVPINNPLGGLGQQAGANLSLVSGSIQEFTVIKDGFDPEYGDALSGVVKITTQTGDKDNLRINAQYITDDFGNKTLNEYSRNSDFMRFSISGPDPLLTKRVFPALGLNFLEDKEFTYYLYAEMEKNDGVYQYDDYNTPSTYLPHDNFNLLGFDIPERRINRYYYMSNLKFRPRQDLRLILSYKRSQTEGQYFDWNYRYSARTAPVYSDAWRTLSLEVSQAIRKNLNYELVLSYNDADFTQEPGDPNNPGQGLTPDDFKFDYEWETYEDRNNNGVYDAPEPVINIFPDTMIYGTDYSGPAYTFGELNIEDNVQGGTQQLSNFRFNSNGKLDNLEGEAFIDLNNNGIWDQGDYLQDKNGNGILDYNRISPINNRTPEPYIDGDSILGEPFTDRNGNGVYDEGIDIFVRSIGPDNQDLNHNGQHDGVNNLWSLGVPYLDRNHNGIYDAPNQRYDDGEPYRDVNGNGIYDYGGSGSFLDPLNYTTDATWHIENTKTYRAELKTFWQVGRHELKAGTALRRLDFAQTEIESPYLAYTGRNDGGPYPDRGSFRDIFSYQPWAGTVYFRDKVEYGSMIASLGLRWDFFLQDKDKLIPVAENDDLSSGIILGDRQKLSPRVGFSYPISDKAKVYFNYGHFFQLPELEQMFRRNTVSVDANTVIGNYNLDYQKTVQYSFGVKYAINETYSADLSGYFKDEFNKINRQSVIVQGIERQRYENSDYGRSRGFELTLEKRGGGYVNGSLSYTYAFAFGKASEASRAFGTPFELSREPLAEAPLDNDVRHSLKSAVQVYIPNTVKPRLFGMRIPNGWSLSIETLIESGRPFTPDRNYPGVVTNVGEDIQRNSLRKPAVVNFDVRFNKDFRFVGLDYSFIVWVENIFNNRNVSSVYASTGRPDTQQVQGDVVHGGTAYDSNPNNWDYGRQVRLGLEVNL